jgi:hypothetical protein
MNARMLTTAALATVLCGALPARAADPQLMNLMMPDAKVIAGVNVDQAKVTPFGQWVLGQMQTQDNHLKELTALTGFDPTRDVHELLVATSGTAAPGQQSGLAAARGNFDAGKIAALVQLHGDSATTEAYKGVTIYEDAKQAGGFAILNPTIAIAGDVANVKAAIDRQSNATPLPAAIAVQVNTWSNSQDAWVITTVPPSTLTPNPGMPAIPGVGGKGQNNAFQNIQQAAGGVKFGANVVVTAQAQAGSAQDATQLGDVVKLIASLAQMQQNADPNLQALVQSLKVTTAGSNLNIAVSIPQDTLIQIIKSGATHSNVKKPMVRK